MTADILLASGVTTVPTDDAGAPGWLTGLVLLALSVGVGWWLWRASSQRVGEEVVQRRKRSKAYRSLAETDDISATLAAAAVLEPSFGAEPEVHVAAVPPVDESGRSLQDRLTDLDKALTTGVISPEEHRVLRAALLEGFPGGWTRPGPVPPPVE
ncbi:MAG: hypothetical protein AB7O74_17150 [Candidatus Nanopelagicales bacterium]